MATKIYVNLSFSGNMKEETMLFKSVWVLLYCCVGFQSNMIPLEDRSIEEQLAECILNISKTYFRKDMPVLIQTPSSYEHPHHEYFQIGGKLIEKFSSQGDFPQMNFDVSKYHNRIKTDIEQKAGSYIFIYPTLKAIEDVHFIYRMPKNVLDYGYNPRATVIIAGLDETARIDTLSATDFMIILYKYGFNNVIVLDPIPYPNNTQQYKYIDIFTLTINEQSNVCSGIKDKIKQIDYWVIQEKRFYLKVDLFPDHQNLDLKNCTLDMYLQVLPPYSYICENQLCGSISYFIDLLQDHFNFNIDIRYGIGEQNYDLIFPTFLNSKIMKYECTFSYPIFHYDIVWIIPSGTEVPKWQNLFRTFSPLIWFLIFLTFVSGTFTIGLIQKSSMEGNEPLANNSTLPIMNGVLTHLGAAIKERSKGFTASIFFILWLYYCMIINVAYQSRFFELLVNPNVLPEIQTIKELEESDVVKTRAVDLPTRSKEFSYIHKYQVCNDDPCWEDLSTDKKYNYALLSEASHAKWMTRQFRDRRGKPKIKILAENLGTLFISLGLRKFSMSCILHDDVDKLLHRATDAGLSNFWYNLIMDTTLKRLVGQGRAPFSLLMSDMESVFYLFIVGHLTAIVAFLVESVIFAFKQ
ncbi:Ionotropic receptor 351 [Blattella germanica]|nr:Ionotropic receptor 351 [Blattella germanica]